MDLIRSNCVDRSGEDGRLDLSMLQADTGVPVKLKRHRKRTVSASSVTSATSDTADHSGPSSSKKARKDSDTGKVGTDDEKEDVVENSDIGDSEEGQSESKMDKKKKKKKGKNQSEAVIEEKIQTEEAVVTKNVVKKKVKGEKNKKVKGVVVEDITENDDNVEIGEPVSDSPKSEKTTKKKKKEKKAGKKKQDETVTLEAEAGQMTGGDSDSGVEVKVVKTANKQVCPSKYGEVINVMLWLCQGIQG